jgi:hypothetical protein
MSYKKAKVKVIGVTPLIWHAFSINALSDERKEKAGKAGNNPEEWRDTVLCDKDGNLYLLKTYVFSCLRAGAAYTKEGKASLKNKMAATLKVLGDSEIYVKNRKLPKPKDNLKTDDLPTSEKHPVYLDICSVVNPSTKGRNARYRIAASKGWEMEFTIGWDNTIVSDKNMGRILEDAGTLVGIGDGRSLGNGRFKIESMEVETVTSFYD